MRVIEGAGVSRLRQEVYRLQVRMKDQMKEILRREPLLKGSVYVRKRRCGREGCRCSRGNLHVSEAFSYSQGGRTKHQALGELDADSVHACVENYRRFRTARAALVKTCRLLLECVGEMEHVRRIGVEHLRETPASHHAVHP